MTIEAVAALERVRADFGEVIRSLSDEEWLLPSACAGWRVRDVVAHVAVYDSYCHLRYDILGPRGPIDRTMPDPAHEIVDPAIQWLMWEVPQTPGVDLAASLRAPTTIALTGPGESSWTISGPGHDGLLVVEEGGEGDVTVVSSAHDFIGWATKRTDWRTSCTIRGDEKLVEGFLDTLNAI